MSTEIALAQLRHAYAQLAAGAVKDQKKFADGLIAPIIRMIEQSNPKWTIGGLQVERATGIRQAIEKYDNLRK